MVAEGSEIQSSWDEIRCLEIILRSFDVVFVVVRLTSFE